MKGLRLRLIPNKLLFQYIALGISLVFCPAGVFADRFVYPIGNRCTVVSDGKKDSSFTLPANHVIVAAVNDSLIVENVAARGRAESDEHPAYFSIPKAFLDSSSGAPPSLTPLGVTGSFLTTGFELSGRRYKPPLDRVNYLNRSYSGDGRSMFAGINYFPLSPDNATMTNFLLRYDLRSATCQSITRSGLMVYSPTPSPDGQWVAYYGVPFESRPELYPGRLSDEKLRGMALCVVRADGGDERILVPHGAYNTSAYTKISWSPDGKTLYFEYRPAPTDPWHAIYRVSLDGTGFAKVSGNHSLAQDPCCSHDGNYLACGVEDYVKSEAGQVTVKGGVALIALQSLDMRLLTDDCGKRPKISPSGTQIIYNALSLQKSGAESLWFVDVKTGKGINLTPDRTLSTDWAFWLE